MIQYQFFPRSQGITSEIKAIIESFLAVENEIDSSSQELKSNDVLQKVRPFLEKNNFTVEKGKSKTIKLMSPYCSGKITVWTNLFLQTL